MSDSQVLYVGPLEDTRKKVIVAAYDYTGDDVDYYTVGTQDHGMINTALAFANEVELSEGSFYLTDNIVFKDNSILEGRGDATVLYINIAASGSGAFSIAAQDCKMRNLQIVRQDSIYEYTVLGASCDNLMLSNISIDGGLKGSVCLTSASGVLIDNIQIKNFGALTPTSTYCRGIYCESVIGILQNSYIYNSATAYGALTGIYISTGTGMSVLNNEVHDLINGFEGTSYWGGTNGIIDNGSYSLISHNRVYNIRGKGSNDGIFTGTPDAVANIVSNNYIRNVKCQRAETDALYGIEVGGSYIQISGNQIIDCWGYGIGVGGTNTIVNGNHCINNGQLIDRAGCESSGTAPTIFGENAPTTSNCTFTFTSTGPYEGNGQYRLTKTVAAGTKARVHLVDNVGAADVHGMIVGTQYELSGWFKLASSASGGYQGLRIYQNTTGASAASATVVTIATASWQWVSITATIYAAATTAYIGIWASSSLEVDHYFDVDELRMFQPGVGNAHTKNFYNGGTNTGSVNSWI